MQTQSSRATVQPDFLSSQAELGIAFITTNPQYLRGDLPDPGWIVAPEDFDTTCFDVSAAYLGEGSLLLLLSHRLFGKPGKHRQGERIVYASAKMVWRCYALLTDMDFPVSPRFLSYCGNSRHLAATKSTKLQRLYVSIREGERAEKKR